MRTSRILSAATAQSHEVNAPVMLTEDKSSRPRPRTKFWPRGQLVLEDLTSLLYSPLNLTCSLQTQTNKTQLMSPVGRTESKTATRDRRLLTISEVTATNT